MGHTLWLGKRNVQPEIPIVDSRKEGKKNKSHIQDTTSTLTALITISLYNIPLVNKNNNNNQ